MSHIIGSKCIGVKDGACILVCPIEDCIVEGEESMYINPETCIDCGACIYECPVEAIFEESEVPEEWNKYIKANYEWFGRDYSG